MKCTAIAFTLLFLVVGLFASISEATRAKKKKSTSAGKKHEMISWLFLEALFVFGFLASDAASYVVGETIEINGGQLML